MNHNSYLSTFNSEYMPSIIKWGRILNLLMVPAMFLPVLAILVVYGVAPHWAGATSGAIAYISFSLPYYFSELIAMGPILHVPGTYIGFIAGNTRNVCACATSSALEVTGVKTGTPEGTVVATIAKATAVIMKMVIVLIIAVLGSWLISVLPQTFLDCLSHLLPALIGAMWMQWFLEDWKLGIIMVGVALAAHFAYVLGAFSWMFAGGEYMRVLICVILGVVIAKAMFKKKDKGDKAEE